MINKKGNDDDHCDNNDGISFEHFKLNRTKISSHETPQITESTYIYVS